LGLPPDKVSSEAIAANQDGSVVAGAGFNFGFTGPRAARWSESAGWELIEGDSTDYSVVASRGISADGNTVVGSVQRLDTPAEPREPFLWWSDGNRIRQRLQQANAVYLHGHLHTSGTEITGDSMESVLAI
jgi:uncharacterized membrane protein